MVYNYECEDCDIRFERFHKVIQPHEEYDPTQCPQCGRKPRRLISLCYTVFKDKPTDVSRWEGKETKWFGTHGDHGNAEKVRQADEKKRMGEHAEKRYYNHKDTTSIEHKHKSKQEVEAGKQLVTEMQKR
tara:strand:- start:8181 stop:8570 length:390 start_codon:yes stop_codon:yes gene_type:complete